MKRLKLALTLIAILPRVHFPARHPVDTAELGPVRSLNVFAAASLKESFSQLARRYQATHPGLTIRLNFAGSQTLTAQINHGAPADVFASAALKNLNDIRYDRVSLRVFARNRLTIAVRHGMHDIRSAEDLSRVRYLAVADPAVPAGRYTESFFAKAGAALGNGWLRTVRSHIVSREADVKSVLAKVRLGEADAGVVYASDVASAAGTVGAVPIPERWNEIAEYPVAIPSSAANRDDARGFIQFLLGSDAQGVLERNGFVSVARPVGRLVLQTSRGSSRLSLPLSAKFKTATVRAKVDGGKETQCRGVLVNGLPGFAGAVRATFIGADLYAQTISTAELSRRKAILVCHPDGNYQLVVAGREPNTWVKWLRRIELR